MTDPVRQVWPGPQGPGQLLRVLRDVGLAWYRLPAEVADMRDPRELARTLFGPGTVGRIDTETVAPRPDSHEIVRNDVWAPLHTDESLVLPAHVQVMICHERAPVGGESTYLDTWALLKDLDEPDLELLLEEPAPLQPVLSLRSGCVVCSLDAAREGQTGPRARFAALVDSAPPVVVPAEPGDVIVIDNHRWLHGREAFSGPRRFTRLLCWLHEPLGVPGWLAERAAAARERRAAALVLDACPAWTRPALVPHADASAARRLAAVLACLAGEPESRVSAEHGIAVEDLRWSVERVMGAALEALQGGADQAETVGELGRALTAARLGRALALARQVS